jgi:hypothetical protein
MEFFFALLFLTLYYLRPQDWVPGMAGFEIIRPVVALWLLALVANRSRPSPLPGFARTPHDWVILAYFAYIVFFGGGSFLEVLPLFAFYALTVQSVNSWPRLQRYLSVWTGLLFALALLGILSTVGIDLTGAQENRNTQLGRLALGTWMHNNPNALGHSIVVVIPAAFLLYFWRGTLTGRFLIFPAMAALAFYCAWMTQSKGAYLVGAALLVIAFVIGKPRWLQITVISAALVVGVSALSFLPRMSDMNNLRADEGVQGRLLAWELARSAERSHPTGVGWKQHVALIPWREGNRHLIVQTATHSSYVQIGADLGRYGLFLYLAGIWCALHSLLVFKSADTMQERCRRVLLVFLIANVISGWMINRQYHTEYFLLIAATAALHRLKKGEELAAMETEENPESPSEPPLLSKTRSPAEFVRESFGTVKQARQQGDTPAFQPATISPLERKPLWNRFGVLDLATCLGMTWLTFWAWDYVLNNL